MNRVVECRCFADECRDLAARSVFPGDRDRLLRMARVWDALAEERRLFLWDHPEIGRAYFAETTTDPRRAP